MSMGPTYKFFGFFISHTILNLPLSILYLPLTLLIPCTFSPFLSLPIPTDNPPCALYFCESVLVVCLVRFLVVFLGYIVDSCLLSCYCLYFWSSFLILFLVRGEGKRGRETSMCGCLSRALYRGPGPQPRHVAWLGINPQPFGSQAGAQSTEPRQSGVTGTLNRSAGFLNFSGPHTLLVRIKNATASLVNSWSPQKLQSYNITQQFLSSKYMILKENWIHTKTCAQMFTAAALIRAINKQNVQVMNG